MATTYEIPRKIGATVTASGGLTAGRHTPINATSGPLTMTLPGGTVTAGAHLSVEKLDSSTNPVTITGTIRGQSSSVSLVWQNESMTFRADGSGSWFPTEGHKTKSSLDRSYVPSVIVTGPGIDPTGVTDSTAAIQAKISSLPASGGSLYFPEGTFLVSSLTCSMPATIVGAGGRLKTDSNTGPIRALTTLVSTSATATCLTLNGTGSVVRDLAIVNDSTTPPTAGVGLLGAGGSQGSLSRVTVLGFYNCINWRGDYWQMDSCHIYDPVNYGLLVDNQNLSAAYLDHGDFGIHNCDFIGYYKNYTGNTAFRWESGGGIRFVGNKINAGPQAGTSSGTSKWAYGIDVATADGTATGDCTITGNSIANFTTAGIRITVQNAGGTCGYFSYATITGNNINVGTGTANVAVFGAPSTTVYDHMGNIEFSGNNLHNVPFGVAAYNMRNLRIGQNIWSGITGSGAYLVSLGGSPDSGSSIGGAHVEHQMCDPGLNPNVDLVVDTRHPQADPSRMAGTIAHQWTSGFYANSAGTWQTIGYVDLGNLSVHQAADLEVLCTLDDHGFGPVYARYRRILTCSGVASVTLTTDGTDTIAGAGTHYAVQFVTTTNNRVIIQIQATTGVTTLQGRVRVTARGDIVRSHRGV